MENQQAAAERRDSLHAYPQVSLQGCHQSLIPRYRIPQAICNIVQLDEVGMSNNTRTANASLRLPVWGLHKEDFFVLGLQVDAPSGDCAERCSAVRPALLADLRSDAGQWAFSFMRGFITLSQFKHDHDCTSTFIKYVREMAEDVAEATFRKGTAVAFRFFFYHVFVFVYFCLAAMGTIAKRVRRRGKKLVPEAFIATTTDHNEFCRAVLVRDIAFRSATTDLGQGLGRCTVDLQLMPRSLDPNHLLDGSAEQPVPPQVNTQPCTCNVRCANAAAYCSSLASMLSFYRGHDASTA